MYENGFALFNKIKYVFYSFMQIYRILYQSNLSEFVIHQMNYVNVVISFTLEWAFQKS